MNSLNDSLKCPCFPLALPDSGQQRVTKLNHQRPFQLTEEEDSPLSSISTIFLVWPLLLLLLLYHRFLLLLLLLRSSLPSFHCSSSTQLLLYSVSPPSSSPWTTLAKRRRPCSWWLKPTKRWRRLDPSWEECSGKGCSPSLFTRVVWCWCVCVCWGWGVGVCCRPCYHHAVISPPISYMSNILVSCPKVRPLRSPTVVMLQYFPVAPQCPSTQGFVIYQPLRPINTRRAVGAESRW